MAKNKTTAVYDVRSILFLSIYVQHNDNLQSEKNLSEVCGKERTAQRLYLASLVAKHSFAWLPTWQPLSNICLRL